MKVKVVKIIHRAVRPNEEGLWFVWCQVYVNGAFRYDCLEFSDWTEFIKLKEGDYVNTKN